MQLSSNMTTGTTGATMSTENARLHCDLHVARQSVAWPSIRVELADFPANDRFEFAYQGDFHLLSICESGQRSRGETTLPDVAMSDCLDLSGRMVFVPRGARLWGWSDSTQSSHWVNIYIEPSALGHGSGDFAGRPMLHFSDDDLQCTARKLGRLARRSRALMSHQPGSDVESRNQSAAQTVARTKAVEPSTCIDLLYAQTLTTTLSIELQHALGHARPTATSGPAATGTLGPWRERKLRDYIHANLCSNLSLSELADVAGLSMHHLARSFHRSFGVPPHGYVVACRMDRARALLATTRRSITDIALDVGYGSASQFTTSFRQHTGTTPSAYRLETGREGAGRSGRKNDCAGATSQHDS